MSGIVARAFRWGLLGLLVGPATVYSVMLIVLYRDPRCAPGGHGGCTLDLALNLSLGMIFGFVLFFGISFARGLIRRARE